MADSDPASRRDSVDSNASQTLNNDPIVPPKAVDKAASPEDAAAADKLKDIGNKLFAGVFAGAAVECDWGLGFFFS